MSENDSAESLRTNDRNFNFKRFLPGEMNVRIDGLVMKKNNRPENEGEWIYTRGNADPSGHFYVTYLGKKYYIHKMVAALFVEVPEILAGREDLIVHHEDEDKSNNSAENLKWMGFSEHSSLHKRGEAHHGAKLTQAEVDQIRTYKGRRHASAVAKEYGVSTKNIYKIWSGEAWKIDS